MGGFFLVAAQVRSPQERAHRGIFYQDRQTFPSDIKPKWNSSAGSVRRGREHARPHGHRGRAPRETGTPSPWIVTPLK